MRSGSSASGRKCRHNSPLTRRSHSEAAGMYGTGGVVSQMGRTFLIQPHEITRVAASTSTKRTPDIAPPAGIMRSGWWTPVLPPHPIKAAAKGTVKGGEPHPHNILEPTHPPAPAALKSAPRSGHRTPPMRGPPVRFLEEVGWVGGWGQGVPPFSCPDSAQVLHRYQGGVSAQRGHSVQ